jgi:light-regulated signal transduction histidine kinase (bacteriophytochrome)
MSFDTNPSSGSAYHADADALRRALDTMANQLSRAVDGDFAFHVETDVQDESLDKLIMLVNFVLEAARRAIEESNERNALLAERNTELEQFAYVASHDLQEPLRMVSSFLQLLQRRYSGQLDERADEYINYAVDGSKRMQTLIRDLLAYSRVGSQEQTFEAIPLSEVIETVLQTLQVSVAETGARIEYGVLPTVLGDRGQLEQLFQNLIANALKFRGDDPPRVGIEARPVDAMWQVWVEDNGIGIAEAHRERIFQIFQRLHNRDEFEGTGIGLAVCKKIVERHGGRIWAESPEAGGTRFVFTLPDEASGPPA